MVNRNAFFFTLIDFYLHKENNLVSSSHREKYLNAVQQIANVNAHLNNNFSISITNLNSSSLISGTSVSKKRTVSGVSFSPKSCKSPKRNENGKIPGVFIDDQELNHESIYTERYDSSNNENNVSKICQSPFAIGQKTLSKYSSAASPYRSPAKNKIANRTPQRVTFPSENLENFAVPLKSSSFLKENQPPRSILKVKTATTPSKKPAAINSISKPSVPSTLTFNTPSSHSNTGIKRSNSILEFSASKKPRKS